MNNERYGVEAQERNSWKGLAAGIIGGVVATAAMTMFQSIWSNASKDLHASGAIDDKDVVRNSDQGGQKEQQQSSDQESSSMKAASIIAERVFDAKLDPSQKKRAGTALHYAFGTVTGAEYGVCAEYLPAVTAGAGTVYGAGYG